MDRTKAMRIEQWCAARDPWRAPEVAGVRISGLVLDGPHAGKVVTTSTVVDAAGRYVETATGSTYVLGDADPDYLATLESNGYPFDPENPIRLKKPGERLFQLRDRKAN